MTDMDSVAYERLLYRWDLPVEKRTVTTTAGRTALIEAGDPDGSPIVLLPGLGTGAAIWFANAGALVADGRRVLALELPGDVGGTELHRTPRRSGRLYRWLGEVLDALDLDDPILAGYGHGGALAAGYAAKRGGVAGLRLIEPTNTFLPMAPPFARKVLPLMVKPDAARAREFYDWELGQSLLDPDVRELLESAATAGERSTVTIRRLGGRALGKLPDDTAVVLGKRSKQQDWQQTSRVIAARCPSARLYVADASHFQLPWTAADTVNTALTSGGIAFG